MFALSAMKEGGYEIYMVADASGGMGVDYAYTLVHKAPERTKHGQRVGPKPAK